MIKFVTVWILTVHTSLGSASNQTYQLTYSTQAVCQKQLEKHVTRHGTARCDFAQIPVVIK